MVPRDATLLVVAAALMAEGRVLVQQRPAGRDMAGLWEFPGGKVEPTETPEQALARELAEELGITVTPDALAPVTFASVRHGDRRLVLLLFGCTRWMGEPVPLHAAALRWVTPQELSALPMPPADVPLVDALAGLL